MMPRIQPFSQPETAENLSEPKSLLCFLRSLLFKFRAIEQKGTEETEGSRDVELLKIVHHNGLAQR